MSRSLRTASLMLLLVSLTATSAIGGQAADPRSNMSDQALKDRIIFRLETDPRLTKYDLRVTVAEGVATIRGDVATVAQKAHAARVANLVGVSRVVTDILVDPEVDKTLADRSKAGLTKRGEKLTDGWIATRVRWLLDREELLKGSDVRVQSSDHVVTLSGTVPTSAAQARAVELSRGTDGVVRVVDQLIIRFSAHNQPIRGADGPWVKLTANAATAQVTTGSRPRTARGRLASGWCSCLSPRSPTDAARVSPDM